MTIVEFLEARIADDAAGADESHRSSCETNSDIPFPCNCGYPARVLRECAAKRAIVERHASEGGVEPWMDAGWAADEAGREYCSWCTYDNRTVRYPCGDIRALASVYADHASFDPRWA